MNKYGYCFIGAKLIYAVKGIADPLAKYLSDDPVRPHIPHEQRFGANSQVYALVDEDNVKAMVCAKFTKGVPSSEQELLAVSDEPDTVTFYTIWSYVPGAGQKLIREGLKHVSEQMPTVKRFVTLSPHTDLARKFHLKNGANVFRVNPDTVNYEYIHNCN